MKTIHLIAGLPRSGSTVLCNILAQNPKFYATATSGLVDTLCLLRNNFDKLATNRATNQSSKPILQAILQSYHQCEQDIIFDKNRGWPAHIEWVEELLGAKVKILVTVRAIPDVLASFEQLHRKTNLVQPSPAQQPTVAGRCEAWMSPGGMVGGPLAAIHDAQRRGLADRLHIIEYGKLCSNPKMAITGIYDFLGEDYHDHDFDHIEQVTVEDDKVYGFLDLHTIRTKLEPQKSRAAQVLGEDLMKKWSGAKS